MKKLLLSFVLFLTLLTTSGLLTVSGVYSAYANTLESSPGITVIELTADDFLQFAVPGWDAEHILSPFSTGEGANRQWGLQDSRGNIVVPANYARIESTSRHISHEPKWLVFRYEELRTAPTGGQTRIRTGAGAYDMHGNLLIPPVYDHIERFSSMSGNGLIPVAMGTDFAGRRWGVVDTRTAAEVVAPVYDEVRLWSDDGMVQVALGTWPDRRWGVADAATGQLVLPAEFAELRTGLPDRMIAATVHGRRHVAYPDGSFVSYPANFALFDASGNVVLPEAHDQHLGIVEAAARIFALPQWAFQPHHANIVNVHWDELRDTLGTQEMEIFHIPTGLTARARSIANGNHADIMGINDHYQAMLATFGTMQGSTLLVTAGGRTMIASIGRFEPSEHFCLHFFGSVQNNDGRSWGVGGQVMADAFAIAVRSRLGN
jgi:hypothetical protein